MAKPKKVYTLISSIYVLFYVTKIFGVIPYGLGAYYKEKILKVSIVGNIWAIVVTLFSCLSSHLESSTVNSGDTDGSGKLKTTQRPRLISLEPMMNQLICCKLKLIFIIPTRLP